MWTTKTNLNTMDKIEIQNKILYVPEYPTIPVIIGDEAGRDIWKNVRLITTEALSKCYSEKRGINWLEITVNESDNENLYESQADIINTYSAGIIVPANHSELKTEKSIQETLQRKLDLYACIRHFKRINGIVTPLRKPDNIDITVIREMSEDIYAGIVWKYNTSEGAKFMHFLEDNMRVKKIRFPRTSNLAVKVISKDGCERITKTALEYARKSGALRLTIAHNSDKEAVTEGAYVDWAYDLIERSLDGKVLTMRKNRETKRMLGEEIAREELENAFAKQLMIVDDLQIGELIDQVLLFPEKFDIVVALNSDGDFINHFISSISGNNGLVPYINLNSETGKAIFGADINTSNPCAMILACASLLEYLNWNEASGLIRKSLERIIAQGKVTDDLSHNFTNGIRLTAEEFSQEIIKMIRNI